MKPKPSSKLSFTLKSIVAGLPVLGYILWFVVTLVDIEIRTPKPDYAEDWSGLGLIVIPFLAFVHLTVSGAIFGASLLIWKLLKKKSDTLNVLMLAMYIPLVVIAVIVGINISR